MRYCTSCKFHPERFWRHDACGQDVTLRGDCPPGGFGCPLHEVKAIEFEAEIVPHMKLGGGNFFFIDAAHDIPIGNYKITMEESIEKG